MEDTFRKNIPICLFWGLFCLLFGQCQVIGHTARIRQTRTSSPEELARKLFGSGMVLKNFDESEYFNQYGGPVDNIKELRCSFDNFCCWQPTQQRVRWFQAHGNIQAERMRASFGSSHAPEGPFLMAIAGFSSKKAVDLLEFHSCTFFASGDVSLTFRHWMSPTTKLSVCWKDVFFGKDNPATCKQVPMNRAANHSSVSFFVPKNSILQVSIVAQMHQRVGGVVAIDDLQILTKTEKQKQILTASQKLPDYDGDPDSKPLVPNIIIPAEKSFEKIPTKPVSADLRPKPYNPDERLPAPPVNYTRTSIPYFPNSREQEQRGNLRVPGLTLHTVRPIHTRRGRVSPTNGRSQQRRVASVTTSTAKRISIGPKFIPSSNVGDCGFEANEKDCQYSNLDRVSKFTVVTGNRRFQRLLQKYLQAGSRSPNDGYGFAIAKVLPGQQAIYQSPVYFYENGGVVDFQMFEPIDGLSLKLCCVAGKNGSRTNSLNVFCPFGTRLGGPPEDWKWKKATIKCPKRTSNIAFVCENKGPYYGACGLDSVRAFPVV